MDRKKEAQRRSYNFMVYFGNKRVGFEMCIRDRSQEVHGENISLDYGDEMVLEQSFRPEPYIFGKEAVRVSFLKPTLQKAGAEEAGTEARLEILPVQVSPLEYVRQTGHRGTLDIDLDRTCLLYTSGSFDRFSQPVMLSGFSILVSEK